MANQNQTMNPFEEEKPKIVHFEKDESHYEYCRMQMHDIEHVHRRTFFCNLAICIFVCLLSVFRVYIGGFDWLSFSGAAGINESMAVLSDGIFQIITAMVIILLGYLAWANFRSLNIILEMWYVVVTIVGIVRLDYITGLIGAIGIVFYFFSIRELSHEESLAQMEGYPEFHEKLDMSNSDFVVQTLMAHKGDRFSKKKKKLSADYSLRKLKKNPEDSPESDGEAGLALAAELQKQIGKVQNQEKAAQEQQAPAAEAPAEQAAAPAPEMSDLTADAAPSADASAAAETPDEILAQAEAKAKALLEEAVAKANALKSDAAAAAPAEQAAPKPQNAAAKQQPRSGGKKKRR
ncbi:MAG: hypothetical protein J5753_03535 [Oscillospiraceae bacterium]|nr:hypothetical protein [Oscillospiraceae bacterium]